MCIRDRDESDQTDEEPRVRAERLAKAKAASVKKRVKHTENKLIALSFLRDSIPGVRGPSFASRMGDRLQTIIPHEVKNHKSSTQASSSTYSINNSHQTRDIANILVEKITAKLHNHNFVLLSLHFCLQYVLRAQEFFHLI